MNEYPPCRKSCLVGRVLRVTMGIDGMLVLTVEEPKDNLGGLFLVPSKPRKDAAKLQGKRVWCALESNGNYAVTVIDDHAIVGSFLMHEDKDEMAVREFDNLNDAASYFSERRKVLRRGKVAFQLKMYGNPNLSHECERFMYDSEYSIKGEEYKAGVANLNEEMDKLIRKEWANYEG